MTPDDYEKAKQAAGLIGVALAAGAAAWSARGRKERNGSSNGQAAYDGPADDSPRLITRKEWHDATDPVSAHGLKLATHEIRIDGLTRELAELKGEFSVITGVATRAGESLARLEERLASHVLRWEEAGERAREDRQQVLAGISAVSSQLTDIYRRFMSGSQD